MDRILCFMFVFFGGGTGCLIRLLVDGTSTQAFSPSNVAACILIGVTYGTARYGIATNKFWLSFFNVGFLGGLSTFTPLAIYALGSQQENIFLAIAVMLGLLLAYTAMTIASAALTSTAVKIFTHGKYQLKMQPRASMRYIFTYMQVAQAAVKIKSIYELQVKSTFPDGSVIEQQLNECRQVLGAIDLLEKQYQQYAQEAKIFPQDFRSFIEAAYDSGVLDEQKSPRLLTVESLNQIKEIVDYNLKCAKVLKRAMDEAK